MLNHPLRIAAAVAVAAALPASAHAAGKTQTLRFYDKTDALVLTQADGTVVDHAPYPEAKPGDALDVYSREYTGDHRRHANRASGSTHLHCAFGAGEPDCVSHAAFGGSMLIFRGNPGTLIAGTGHFLGARGRVLSNTEVRGGND